MVRPRRQTPAEPNGDRFAGFTRRLATALSPGMPGTINGVGAAPAPAPAPRLTMTYASIADQVEEGVMIASAGVRLAVKNLIITRALRDQADFDLTWYLEATSREFTAMAEEKASDAERIGREAAVAALKRGRPTRSDDFRDSDVHHLRLREQIMRQLSETLRDLCQDATYIRSQVDLARQLAADELARATAMRLVNQPHTDDEYLARRAGRLVLLNRDLSRLTRPR